MAEWKPLTDEEFERQFERANEAGKPASEHAATMVSYDRASNRIVLELKRGVTILIAVDRIEELKAAPPDVLAAVALLPGGLGLTWESLDVDISVPGLLVDVLGTRPLLSEVGKRARGKTSEVKAAASRVNGRKGGRPRKVV
jgi:hypothetical protein